MTQLSNFYQGLEKFVSPLTEGVINGGKFSLEARTLDADAKVKAVFHIIGLVFLNIVAIAAFALLCILRANNLSKNFGNDPDTGPGAHPVPVALPVALPVASPVASPVPVAPPVVPVSTDPVQDDKDPKAESAQGIEDRDPSENLTFHQKRKLFALRFKGHGNQSPDTVVEGDQLFVNGKKVTQMPEKKDDNFMKAHLHERRASMNPDARKSDDDRSDDESGYESGYESGFDSDF